MLGVSRVLVRDQKTRALLFVVDAAATPVRVEADDHSLRIDLTDKGRPVVDAPEAHLELLSDEAVQFVGSARLKGERELRHVRVTLELR